MQKEEYNSYRNLKGNRLIGTLEKERYIIREKKMLIFIST